MCYVNVCTGDPIHFSLARSSSLNRVCTFVFFFRNWTGFFPTQHVDGCKKKQNNQHCVFIWFLFSLFSFWILFVSLRSYLTSRITMIPREQLTNNTNKLDEWCVSKQLKNNRCGEKCFIFRNNTYITVLCLSSECVFSKPYCATMVQYALFFFTSSLVRTSDEKKKINDKLKSKREQRRFTTNNRQVWLCSRFGQIKNL